MDAHPSSKSHATTWVLAVVAVPVLYVLTFPVVVFPYRPLPGRHHGPLRQPGWWPPRFHCIG